LIKLERTPHEWAWERMVKEKETGDLYTSGERGVAYLAGLIEGYTNDAPKMFTLEDLKKAVLHGIFIHNKVVANGGSDVKGKEGTIMHKMVGEYLIECMTKYTSVELEITNVGSKRVYYCSSMAEWVPKVDEKGYVNRNKLFLK
jgi:hypothetical protein